MGFMADMGAVPPVTLTAWNLSHSCVVLTLCFKFLVHRQERNQDNNRNTCSSRFEFRILVPEHRSASNPI